MTFASEASDNTSVQATLQRAWRTHGVLVVTAQSSAALDQWGRAFAREVRSRQGAQLEIYMPATSDTLIARFNELLSGLSLDRARADPSPDANRRFILVPDIRAFDSSEGLLLARLATDFPGAATRLVLLIDQSEWSRSQSLLASLGRHVHKVNLSDPSSARLSPVRERADKGIDSETEQAQVIVPVIGPQQAERVTVLADSVPMVRLEAARRSRFSWLGAGALVMALLLISALIVVLLHREPGPGARIEPRSAVAMNTELSRATQIPVAAPKHIRSGA